MINTFSTAVTAFQKHAALHPLAHYTGILSLHAYARLALISGNPAVLDDSRRHLLPLVRGEVKFQANFSNYYCGGNGAAFLFWQGKLPEAEVVLRQAAEDTLQNARRDENGIFCMPRAEGPKIWIDVAFAVTPFLLFAGLAFQEDAYIEEAFQQTCKMVEIFRDPENELLHQARGFTAPGVLSQDHWSRGNGWGILALTELVQYLPAADPRRPKAEAMFTRLANACLQVQDEQGLWRQEMTDFKSYVETSGTGLILYALGVGIAQGLLPPATMASFLKGLRGYSQYILPDGTVFHTCRGNLNPGAGTIADYKQAPPVVNDPHAFGPVTLAFGQALKLGITELVG
jgi:unsaturated rhamnogalacturonyl hydrolase